MTDLPKAKNESELGSNEETAKLSSCLEPLTPQFDSDKHSYYVTLLNDAVQLDGVYNIALSGPHGSGKSSILQAFQAEHIGETIQINLATLNPTLWGDVSSGGGRSYEKEQLIQKEFVKQLLYREPPYKTPGSRFHRLGIQPILWWSPIGSWGATVLLVLYAFSGGLSEVHTFVSNVVKAGTIWGYLGTGVVWLLLWLLAQILISTGVSQVPTRLRLKSFTAGPAIVSLHDEASSYFDKYLDEIVYFFERTKYSYVLIEDIDRFKEPRVFETLRSLNIILNQSKQVGRVIRFIYAVRDGSWAGADASRLSTDESESDSKALHKQSSPDRQDRAKFFDLVVPVVPFTTQHNAVAFMKEKFKEVEGDSPFSSELLELAGSHIVDARAILNIRNEYVVYREILKERITGDTSLSADGLLSMMLYKHLHPQDFELIQSGKSRLNNLYRASRKFIGDLNVQLHREIRQYERFIVSVKNSDLDDPSNLYATDEVHRSIFPPKFSLQNEAFEGFYLLSNDVVIDLNQMMEPTFWRSLRVRKIQVVGMYRQLLSSVHGPERVQEKDGEPLAVKEVEERFVHMLLERCTTAADAASRLQKQIDFLNEQIEKVRAARFVDLFHAQISLVSEEHSSLIRFENIVDDTVGCDLTLRLVEHGFIDELFPFYASSVFPASLSLDAEFFITHCIDGRSPDYWFALSSSEIEAVFRHRRFDMEMNSGWHNLAIAQHIFEGGSDQEPQRERLWEGLLRLTSEDQTFLAALLENENTRGYVLSRRDPKMFNLVIRCSSLDIDEKRDWVMKAFSSGALVSMALRDHMLRRFILNGSKTIQDRFDTYDARMTVDEFAQLVERLKHSK